MRIRPLRHLAVALTLSAAAYVPAHAQQQTWNACYVPDVGALYLIGLEGLPTACLSTAHVEVSWTEGGAAVTDHGGLTGLADDDHPEYVREGEAAAGDLGGSYPAPSVTALRGLALAATAPTAGQVLTWNATASQWEPQVIPSGVTDHGNLAGLADDDHPEYVREGEAAGGDLGGSYPTPLVTALRGLALSQTPPTDGQVMIWNAGTSEWEPQALPSGVSDHGALAGLADDDHPEYVREGEAAAGDLAGTYPAPTVTALRGQPLALAPPKAGQVLTWNETATQWEAQAVPSGVTDHGALTGLADDDHPEYVREGEAAAGDLAGTYPAPTVGALRGRSVATTAPADGQVLTWNGSATAWEPQTASTGVTDHGALAGLGDDDHPGYLPVNGVRGAVDGFAVTGNLNTGAIPTEGAGVRLMWYPAKAAFRVGRADGTQWDDANVGLNSMAMGSGTVASGAYSTALGAGTTASGFGSTATGSSTTASSNYSVAMGYGSVASNYYSTAMGVNTTADGHTSTAFGSVTVASGSSSTAMGHYTTATGAYSTAMGNGTTASGHYSTAMGRNTTSQASYSLAIGTNNVVAGAISGWFSGDPLLVAGNGTSTTPSNALTLYKNGNLTIAGTLTESSDRRLKLGIEPLGTTLDDLHRIHPVRFRFRSGTGHPADLQIGLLAQEVEAVFPELVNTDSRGYLSLAYPKLTAVLVAAVQELEARNRALEARTRDLEARLARLEAARPRP